MGAGKIEAAEALTGFCCASSRRVLALAWSWLRSVDASVRLRRRAKGMDTGLLREVNGFARAERVRSVGTAAERNMAQ